jgi:glycosyltransferase involved in cell wall biosynthesis
MSEPRVSVVMPLYNAARHLPQSLDSVLAQTFTDFEIIAVDDGSSDRTLKILREYEARDPRLRVLSRPNTGIVGALNDGLSMARPPLIARMDGDDVCLPTRFERQVAYMDEHPECVLLGSQVLLIDDDGSPICPHPQTRYAHGEIDDAHLGTGWPVVHPSIMLRKAAVERVGRYREQYKWLEDLDLFLRLAEIGKLANLRETLLHYRLHLASVCHTQTDVQAKLRRQMREETYRRRGLPNDGRNHADPSRHTPGEIHRLWAWWALKAGNVSTARKHALHTLRAHPWSPHSWRVLACAVRGY